MAREVVATRAQPMPPQHPPCHHSILLRRSNEQGAATRERERERERERQRERETGGATSEEQQPESSS
jgi:hypothetical protein